MTDENTMNDHDLYLTLTKAAQSDEAPSPPLHHFLEHLGALMSQAEPHFPLPARRFAEIVLDALERASSGRVAAPPFPPPSEPKATMAWTWCPSSISAFPQAYGETVLANEQTSGVWRKRESGPEQLSVVFFVSRSKTAPGER